MKENLKNQLKIFLLLLAMMTAVMTGVLLIVIDIFWLIKIFVVIGVIILTAYIFICIKKINKKLVYIEPEQVVEVENNNTGENKKRCPKCYNHYDGQYCFVCGYKKENKD